MPRENPDMATNFIQIDTKAVEDAIKNTKLRFPTILVRLQKKVNQQVIKSAKARFRSQFNINNHNSYTLTNAKAENNAGKNALPILKNFKNQKSRSEKGVTWILNNAYYADWLESGAEISAKNGKYLTFKVGGEWRKVESVTLPARPFVKPAVDEFWNSGKQKEIQEAELEKILKKYWDKEKAKQKES